MGWTFTHGASRADIIAEVVGIHSKIHAKAFVGNTMWTVAEGSNGEKFVACILLQRSSYGWGYKVMDEGMGPVQVSCPLSFLDMADDPTGYAVAWREKVRAYHTKRTGIRQNLAVGATLVLKPTCRPGRLLVTQVRPLRAVDPDTRAAYAVPMHMVASVEPSQEKTN